MPPLINVGLVAERFWARVDRSAGDVACWPWTRSTTAAGYGSLGWKNAPSRYAHISAYVLTYGPLPDDRPCVLHECDNPICCNPTHLRAGTMQQNSADMVRRKRSAAGADNPNAKINDDCVRDIRRRVAGGASMSRVAKAFGITHSTVSLIMSRRIWRHVE